MKLSFSLNWMGVVSTRWYDDHNIPHTLERKYSEWLGKEITLKHYEKYYSCGRIDVYGHPEHPWNFEYGVDVMEGRSWNVLGDWLEDLVLDYLPDTVEEIYEMFEKETGHKIAWFKTDDN